MNCCDLCLSSSEEIKHLPLYTHGSEGINVCLQCRIILTEVARGLRSVSGKARMRAYKDAKKQTKKQKEKIHARKSVQQCRH